MNAGEQREITVVSVGNVTFPAAFAICPECGVLDLDTYFEYLGNSFSAKCSRGHRWGFTIGSTDG